MPSLIHSLTRRISPALVLLVTVAACAPAGAQQLIGVSIPVNSMDSGCRPVNEGVWAVNPLNVNSGIGYLVNLAHPVDTDFVMHDHQYASPYAPDPARAVVTYTFSSPVTVHSIVFEQHANGITQIEGFAGSSEATLASIGTIFGPSGDVTGYAYFAEHLMQTFTFPNPQPGKVFRFIVRKTNLDNGWACYRAFPQFGSTSHFISSFTVTPNSVVGTKSATGKVILNAAAPASGAVIALSALGLPAATLPSSMTIPAGMTTKTFTVKTGSVGAAQVGTIQANYNGSAASAPLTIRPLSLLSLALAPTVLTGPASSTGTVKLEAPVPAAIGSVTVTLGSNSAAAVPSVPSLTFVTGEHTKTFIVDAAQVAAKTVATISATLGSKTLSKTLTINRPLGVASLTLNPTSVVGPATSTGTVKLDAPVPAAMGSLVVTLTSDSGAATPAVGTLTFNTGEQTKTFTINTMDVSMTSYANIKAAGNGSSVTKKLTVK